MDESYSLQNVPIEIVLDIARVINTSPIPLSKDSLEKSLIDIGKSYKERGIRIALQLNLIKMENEDFIGNDDYKNDFIKIPKEKSEIIARKVLQNFPPFLTYVQYLQIGYDHKKAGNITSGIYEMNSSTASNFLKKSGLYCGILTEQNGKVVLSSTIKPDVEYLQNLTTSLKSEFEATNFIISLLSQEVYNYFSKKGLNFKRASEGLVEIKKDPKTSLYKVFEDMESCIFALGKDIGANVSQTNGLGQLINSLRAQNAILTNPLNLGLGLGAIRNMADHGPDKNTGKPWSFTEEAALGTALLSIRFLRSLYLYHYKHKQEL